MYEPRVRKLKGEENDLPDYSNISCMTLVQRNQAEAWNCRIRLSKDKEYSNKECIESGDSTGILRRRRASRIKAERRIFVALNLGETKNEKTGRLWAWESFNDNVASCKIAKEMYCFFRLFFFSIGYLNLEIVFKTQRRVTEINYDIYDICNIYCIIYAMNVNKITFRNFF